MRDEFEAQTQAENSLDHLPESGPTHTAEPPKNKPVDELILKDELRSPSQMTKESGYFSNPRSTNPSGKLSLLNVSCIEQFSSQNYLRPKISTLTQLRLARCKFYLQNNTPQTLNEPTNNSKTYQNITANDSPRLSASALSKTSQRTGQQVSKDKSSFLNNGRAMFGGHQRASTRRSNSNFLAEVIRPKLF